MSWTMVRAVVKDVCEILVLKYAPASCSWRPGAAVVERRRITPRGGCLSASSPSRATAAAGPAPSRPCGSPSSPSAWKVKVMVKARVTVQVYIYSLYTKSNALKYYHIRYTKSCHIPYEMLTKMNDHNIKPTEHCTCVRL
jgi:hypothetical protein